MKTPEVRDFIIKYTILSSIIVWILGAVSKDFLTTFLKLIIEPFFSIDLNDNGEPDLKELYKYKIKIGRFTFPLGKLIVEIIVFLINIIVIYYIIYYIIHYTNLIDLNLKKK